MTLRILTPFVLVTALAACGPATADGNNASGDAHVFDHDANVSNNNNVNTNTNQNTNYTPPTNSRIYVNTETTLYYIDPGVSDELVEIGPFSGPCTSDSGFFDIAVDEGGGILGIAELGLYHVDSETAACSYAFQFPVGSPYFYSLSFVKGVDPADPSADKLIAAANADGEWVQINYPGDVISEIFHHLGYYDFPDYAWVPSGDIVSIQTDWTEYVCYATLECADPSGPDCDSDWLAEIEPPNGDAHIIGRIGFSRIFGLGFWGDKVYGFTADGEYITIDVTTGAGTLVQQFTDRVFWGAGNTTIPYIVR